MADVRIKPWHISLDGPVSEYSESLFAVGNGCLGMRGFSLQTPKRRPYDHAVFRAGFFEPIRPGVTDMVQLPDALGLRVVGEEPEQVSQELDLRTGVFTQRWARADRGRGDAAHGQHGGPAAALCAPDAHGPCGYAGPGAKRHGCSGVQPARPRRSDGGRKRRRCACWNPCARTVGRW